jgi:histidine ammonia-lyase
MPVTVGERLTLEDVLAVAAGEATELSGPARERMAASRRVVDEKVASGELVYGVTTGIGDLATVRIPPERARQLQHDILMSHAVGVGPPLSQAETRAMLLLRAHVLAKGHSGVRPEVVDLLLALLNRRIHPVVPEQGSLGASGDLAPLSHLALPLIGLGEVFVDDVRRPSAAALADAGLRPLALEAKEGLALANGTQAMLAVGLLTVARAQALAKAVDVAAAMTIEAVLGTDGPFDERLHALRPHVGQTASAANLRGLMAGSGIVSSHRDSVHLVQDAYSLRCAPQVHGAFRDAVAHARSVLEVEMESVVDNPIVIPETGEVLSGGNFHGQPVANVLDHVAAATVSMASISERRLYRILDPAHSHGLPPFLVEESGLNSGYMLVQYTAASLVSESKSLAHPAAVDSIPSSAGQEDHVSMGMTAARHARDCVTNAEAVVAFEALAAAQGLDFRAPLAPGAGSEAGRAAVRSRVAHLDADREVRLDMDAAADLVRSGELVGQVESAVGPLA